MHQRGSAVRQQEKNRVRKVKELRGRERRKVNQQLDILADRIIEYARQFPKLIIVMENPNGIRSFKNQENSTNTFTDTLRKTLNIY